MIGPLRAGQPEVPGLATRRIAADVVDGVLRRGRLLDEQLDGTQAHAELGDLADRDRAFVRRIVGTVMRRLGTLRFLIGSFLDRGLPGDAPRVETALLVGAAQIVFLEVPDHAAVDLAVRLTQADRRSARYAGLVNAVLRRVGQTGQARLAGIDPTALDTPDWLMKRWVRIYGRETARAIAKAHIHEPSLDLTVKSDAQGWADKLHGRVLPTGTVRLIPHGPVSQLPGYLDGEWWVQDAAAALPVRLIGDVNGLQVADLCAAPGGKTLQLASAGACVTAVDRSESRVARLNENLHRLGFEATTVVSDAADWNDGPFDAVLIDAPCSSTGTIRRHPDIPWLKSPDDLPPLVDLQHRLLDRAIEIAKPGGTIMYCTCSLEPEEGEQAIVALLERNPQVRRRPIRADELSGLDNLLTADGDLRTLPCHWPDPEPRMAGLDGFFASRLERI